MAENQSKSPFLALIDDEHTFLVMRHKLLGQPTPRQTQVAVSAALADLDNDHMDEQPTRTEETTKQQDEKVNSNTNKLFVHYTHEKRFESFKRDMHTVYEDVFAKTPAMHAKIVVGNRNRRDTRNELVRKRPPRTILRNTITQSKEISRHRTLCDVTATLLSGENTSKAFFRFNRKTQEGTTPITNNWPDEHRSIHIEPLTTSITFDENRRHDDRTGTTLSTTSLFFLPFK